MDKEYHCSDCNKQYASYKSLWNHNKKIHGIKSKGGNHFVATMLPSSNHLVTTMLPLEQKQPDEQCILKCKYCKKMFNHRTNRWRHEKTCKEKEKQEQEKEEKRIQEEKKLYLQIKKEENESMRLQMKKDKLTNSSKSSGPLTVQKLNKSLQMYHSNINSNNTQNNITIENQHNNLTIESPQIVQNFQLIQVGKEQDIPLLLTNQEKMTILKSRRFALQKITEILHGGSSKYKQFKTVIVTNLRNKYIYKYDIAKRGFITASAEDVMALLVDSRLSDLETIYDQNISKIDALTKKSLERFINEMREPGSDSRRFEIEQIKMLLFNDRDKIMSDIEDEISLVLTVVEV